MVHGALQLQLLLLMLLLAEAVLYEARAIKRGSSHVLHLHSCTNGTVAGDDGNGSGAAVAEDSGTV